MFARKGYLVFALAPALTAALLFACLRDPRTDPSQSTATTSQPLNLSPTIGNFVLYAERSIHLGIQDQLKGGDIGIAATTVSSFGSQLVVGEQTQVSPANNILSPSTTLGFQAQVGDVETNALTNNGAESLGTVAPYPASLMPPLPFAGNPAAPTSDVTVASHEHVALSPGAYATLTIGDQAHVALAAGSYSFSSISIGDQVQLTGDSGGVTLLVSGTFATGSEDQINHQGGANANALTIVIGGNDGSGGTPSAASIGPSTHITALLAAPHGTMAVAADAQLTGAFAAFDIVLADYVHVNYEAGFSPTAGLAGRQLVPSSSIPGAQAGLLLGPVPGDTPMSLGIQLPLQNADLLTSMLNQMYDPQSPQYQDFLSPGVFASTFASSSVYQQLMSWATAQGLHVTYTSGDNFFLIASGPASVIERTFFVNMTYYARPGGGTFLAPDRPPTTLLTLGLFEVSGFSNFNVARNSFTSVPASALRSDLIGQGVSGTFYGPDLRSLYAPGTTLDGTNQSLALYELDDYFDGDVTAYETFTSPPISTIVPQRIQRVENSIPGVVPPPDGNEDEVALDIEMAIAMAPNLQNIYVYEDLNGDDVDTASGWIFSQFASPGSKALSNQVSCSWNGFASATVVQFLVKMAAQGQSAFISSGDSGAYVSTNSLANNMLPTVPIWTPPPPLTHGAFCAGDAGIPSSLGFPGDGGTTCYEGANMITVVGGTQVGLIPASSKVTCLTEEPWNDPLWLSHSGSNNGPGGGGVCPDVPIPSYQPATILTTDNGSTTNRNIPDVSALADSVMIVATNTSNNAQGQIMFSGGTSAAAPIWAGFMALVHEQRSNAGFGPVGLLNPYLLGVGQSQHYQDSMFDVTSGTINPNPSDPGHWSAVTGYDLATGWGTPRLGLINALAAPAPPVGPVTYATANIVVSTGGDDLRCTSTAKLFLLDPNANPLQSFTLHSDGNSSWDNNTTHSVSPGLNPPLSANDIAFVQLQLIQGSGTCQIFTTSDNWNVSSLSVMLSSSSNGSVPLVIFFTNQSVRLKDGSSTTVTWPTSGSLACPLVCASGMSCGVQGDCSAGICTGGDGSPGSGCCAISYAPCGCASDCPSPTSCVGGNGTCGDQTSGVCL